MTGLTMTYVTLIDAAHRLASPRPLGPRPAPAHDCLASIAVGEAFARSLALISLAESELHAARAAVESTLRAAPECVSALDAECARALL
ncbi:hypothetical protein GCM10022198_23980 [Klugiella xanthotipulae]|uniref:Uncharacterized protein n=1 Tax=Klugiella xanthotipulae TaxID=244735 RepID=A0A543I6G0_9MICO|nr:hypothetical protein [Klugiella xanthotipulae]TQM66155.1 hypothetical protein FB466_0985 [Klugiella xanthotipulae]